MSDDDLLLRSNLWVDSTESRPSTSCLTVMARSITWAPSHRVSRFLQPPSSRLYQYSPKPPRVEAEDLLSKEPLQSQWCSPPHDCARADKVKATVAVWSWDLQALDAFQRGRWVLSFGGNSTGLIFFFIVKSPSWVSLSLLFLRVLLDSLSFSLVNPSMIQIDIVGACSLTFPF